MGTDVTDESPTTDAAEWGAGAMHTQPTAEDLLSLFPQGSRTDDDGTLMVGGCRLDDVAAEFGTPAIVVAEDALRNRARDYLNAFRSRWPRANVAFASKSFPCTAVQRVMVQEDLHLDVAGGGGGITPAKPGGGAAARYSPRSRRVPIRTDWSCTATPRPTRSSSWRSSTDSGSSSSTTS